MRRTYSNPDPHGFRGAKPGIKPKMSKQQTKRKIKKNVKFTKRKIDDANIKSLPENKRLIS
jgi:hypothetical protein